MTRRVLIGLVSVVVLFGGARPFASGPRPACAEPVSPAAVVKKVDHVVALTNDPGRLFAVLTEDLGLPMAWPLISYPGFASGGVQMGNVNLEILHFDKGTKPFYPGAPPAYREGGDASLFGVVFEPYPLSAITEELRSRGTSPGSPSDQMGEFGGRPVTLWTSVFLESLGLDSYVVYLCEYSPGYRAMLQKHAAKPPLGRIGMLSVREIVVGAKDLTATRKAWDRFLAPVKGPDGVYTVGGGPALRLVESGGNRIVSLVLEVASLPEARGYLEKHGLLGRASEHEVSILPSRVQSLEIRLVEGR